MQPVCSQGRFHAALYFSQGDSILFRTHRKRFTTFGLLCATASCCSVSDPCDAVHHQDIQQTRSACLQSFRAICTALIILPCSEHTLLADNCCSAVVRIFLNADASANEAWYPPNTLRCLATDLSAQVGWKPKLVCGLDTRLLASLPYSQDIILESDLGTLGYMNMTR